MPFKKLIFFMLNLVNSSSQVALLRFSKIIGDCESITQQAFSKARNKINHLPLLEFLGSGACNEILRINRLVDDLGKLARYENSNLVLNKTKFNLSRLIKNTIKSYESDSLKENKEITFHGASLDIFADKDKINQVLLNLISNSLKFTGANGKIEII